MVEGKVPGVPDKSRFPRPIQTSDLRIGTHGLFAETTVTTVALNGRIGIGTIRNHDDFRVNRVNALEGGQIANAIEIARDASLVQENRPEIVGGGKEGECASDTGIAVQEQVSEFEQLTVVGGYRAGQGIVVQIQNVEGIKVDQIG